MVRNGGAPEFMRVAASRREVDLRVPGRAPSDDGCSQSRAAIEFSQISPCPATHSKFKRGTFEDAGVAAQIFNAQLPLSSCRAMPRWIYGGDLQRRGRTIHKYPVPD